MLNPSVSPFKISANGLVVESSNPAVRLYRYNTYTGEVRLSMIPFLFLFYYLQIASILLKLGKYYGVRFMFSGTHLKVIFGVRKAISN